MQPFAHFIKMVHAFLQLFIITLKCKWNNLFLEFYLDKYMHAVMLTSMPWFSLTHI